MDVGSNFTHEGIEYTVTTKVTETLLKARGIRNGRQVLITIEEEDISE